MIRRKNFCIRFIEKCYHSISFKESKADSLIAEDSPHHLDLITLTQRHLIRVYPGSMRQDSSNLHPLFYWTYGKKKKRT